MGNSKSKTKLKNKDNLAERLNQVPIEKEDNQPISPGSTKETKKKNGQSSQIQNENQSGKVNNQKANEEVQLEAFYSNLFDVYDDQQFDPKDFMVEVPIASLESAVGYSSLMRQMHQSFIRMVAFYKSPGGGSLSTEEARSRAFHVCTDKEEAKKLFQMMMRQPLESLDFSNLFELHSFAPRVAERFWERAKREGRKEFESGHLAANITFPTGYMKGLWNIARYLGVRESFIDDWKPKGGIEIALVDMLAQSYFQWQYWLEQTVRRSQTKEREEHPQYLEWQRQRKKFNEGSWMDGHWLAPTLSERAATEQAVQMADRFNRIFMRTLRQLRDLRRYSPVTINNPSQVNIATEGGQQINVSKNENDQTKKITS